MNIVLLRRIYDKYYEEMKNLKKLKEKCGLSPYDDIKLTLLCSLLSDLKECF